MSRIVVTGANRGIGLEIARQLAVVGHEVIITSRDVAKGELAIGKMGTESRHIKVLKLDLGDERSREDFIRKVHQDYQSIDGLVNNAGVSLDERNTLESVGIDTFRQTMEVNFYGPLVLIRGLLPLLRKSKDPRVVNLSSGLGALNEMGGGYPSYRISKTALNAMSAIFGSELGPEGVLVNGVCPGWVQTDMGGKEAPRSVAEGADTPVWLMTADRSVQPQGKFLRDRKVIDW